MTLLSQSLWNPLLAIDLGTGRGCRLSILRAALTVSIDTEFMTGDTAAVQVHKLFAA